MQGLSLNIYPPNHPILKKLIKYYWIIQSDQEVYIDNQLIPVNNIDFILNLSNPIRYINGLDEETFSGFHLSGIRSNYHTIQQNGFLDIIGISFYPTGVYPFINIPLSEFSNRLVSLDSLIPGFEKYADILKEVRSSNERISIIERWLMKQLNLNLLPESQLNLIVNDFIARSNEIRVSDYCNRIGVNQKTLERHFNRYIGTTPKSFIKIARVQKLAKYILTEDIESLSRLTYDYSYFDQTHFINDFKSLIGTTPLKFIKQNNTIMNVLAND